MTIPDALALVQSQPPAPVVLIDTCSLLDLFRADESQSKVAFRPRVPHQEVRAAADLFGLVTGPPRAAHLFVPELIPREYQDHAATIETKFAEWTALHDHNQEWVFEVAASVPPALPTPHPVHPHRLAPRLRALADNLLGTARVLDRDPGCLDRAVQRLIHKVRPSHRKEVKDSMNLEQCLELSARLGRARFPRSRVWVSSNTSDFAQSATSPDLNTDLRADFAVAGLGYHTSIRAALTDLRAKGEL